MAGYGPLRSFSWLAARRDLVRRRSWQARRATWAAHPEPNAAHRAIAGLERSGVAVRVITQNVDGLTPRVLTRLQREFTEGSARV